MAKFYKTTENDRLGVFQNDDTGEWYLAWHTPEYGEGQIVNAQKLGPEDLWDTLLAQSIAVAMSWVGSCAWESQKEAKKVLAECNRQLLTRQSTLNITFSALVYYATVSKGVKTWNQIGQGTQNPDGSLDIKLDSLPISGEIRVVPSSSPASSTTEDWTVKALADGWMPPKGWRP